MQQSGRLFWRNGFVCGCRRQKAELRFSHAGYRCLLVAKGSKHSLRLLFFAAFWSAKSGAKTDPPTKKAKRRGLTLAPGDYSRVCKQTVPSARAFSPHLSERLFCQAGVVRRGTWREGCVRNKQEAQKPTIAPGSGFKPPHSRLERNEDNRGLRPRGTLYFLAAKSTDRSLRLVLFAAFWSAVNRGLRPRRVMYFLTAKSTKNSPADAFAYFVPANVRNGRLFAGLQANRPRFLPLLAGTSFRGSGIGPESFAAVLSFRPGEQANRGEHPLFACSCRILP